MFMEDYKKPFTLKDKIKKSVGMKVRQKYGQIPLLSEEEIREKYKEEDWGFLVNYVKQHKDIINKGKELEMYTKTCPVHKVKLIKIAWQIHHSQGAGNFPEYRRICPICGNYTPIL
jgi:hypothetical protein